MARTSTLFSHEEANDRAPRKGWRVARHDIHSMFRATSEPAQPVWSSATPGTTCRPTESGSPSRLAGPPWWTTSPTTTSPSADHAKVGRTGSAERPMTRKPCPRARRARHPPRRHTVVKHGCPGRIVDSHHSWADTADTVEFAPHGKKRRAGITLVGLRGRCPLRSEPTRRRWF